MYLDYFDLKEKPFSLSPDPKYLYFSRSHKEALAQMIYAATQNTGFMVLTGEVGTGKTVLINALIDQFPKNYHFAKIYHSAVSPEGLIQNICKEFKLDYTNKSITELVLEIQDFLKWNYNSGGKSILILDEAQNLSVETLEEIRLLSNFESGYNKIMQIYLVGQPELENKLSKSNLRQLRERVSLKFVLDVLNRDETKLYINHRLMIAGLSKKTNLFLEEAIDEIYKISEGIPRRINILCDTALLLAYSNLFGTNRSKEITADTIKKSRASSQMELYSTRELTDKAIQYFNKKSKTEDAEDDAAIKETTPQIKKQDVQETIKSIEDKTLKNKETLSASQEKAKKEFKDNVELLRRKQKEEILKRKVVPLVQEKNEKEILKVGNGSHTKENPESELQNENESTQTVKKPDENTLQKKAISQTPVKAETDPPKHSGNGNHVNKNSRPAIKEKTELQLNNKPQSAKNPADDTTLNNKVNPQSNRKTEKISEELPVTEKKKKEDSTEELQLKKIEQLLNDSQSENNDPPTKTNLKSVSQFTRSDETIKRPAIVNRTKEDSTQELHRKAVEQLIKDSQTIKAALHAGTPVKNTAPEPQTKNTNIVNGAGSSSIDYEKIENIVNQIIEDHNIFFAKKPKFKDLFFGGILAFIIIIWAFYIAILLSVEFGILK